MYEWDEAKNQANIAVGRPGFGAVEDFEWETAMIFVPALATVRHAWGAIGYLGDRLHYVVYSRRGDKRRIISLRRASKKEEEGDMGKDMPIGSLNRAINKPYISERSKKKPKYRGTSPRTRTPQGDNR